MSRIVILGAGAWGTALAHSAVTAGHTTTVWARHITKHTIPQTATITNDLVAVREADAVLLVTPAQATRDMLAQMDALPVRTPLVLCGKGLDRATGMRLDELVHGWRPTQRTAYLSGPNFAGEVLAGKPTAGVIAAPRMDEAEALCQMLSTPLFRLYANDDMVGVGLLGALKNPLAIGAGIIAGAAERHNLGENTRAAFITRGLAEITRLGLALGAKPATFAGLAGVGDIILTCSSVQSRNYRYGLAVGNGETPDSSMTVEGLPTIAAAHALAAERRVELPLMEALYDLLYQQQPLGEVLQRLLSRPLKQEA